MCPLLPGQPGELGRHPRVTNTASAECSVGEHCVPKELPKGTGCRGSGGGKRGVSGRPSEKRQDSYHISAMIGFGLEERKECSWGDQPSRFAWN